MPRKHVMAADERGYSVLFPTAAIRDDAVIEHPVHFRDQVEIQSGARIGRFTYINARSVIYRNVTIGRYTSIGRHAEIGAPCHPLHFLSTHPFQYIDEDFPEHPVYREIRHASWSYLLDTTIGSDVWIGSKALVRTGVSVGDGAVIAAGAVVVSDIPPYAIYGGVPARLIRYRFAEALIARLLAVRWWDLPIEQLRDLPFEELDACLDRLEEFRSNRTAAVAQ